MARLSDDEFRDVLARAEEIQREARDGDDWHAELQAVVQAGQEIGLPRYAIEQAIRERLDVPYRLPEEGELTFARSANGRYYVAEVLSASLEGIRVRFLRGGEHTVLLNELRPCSFLPGEKIGVPWPLWGDVTSTVESYHAEHQQVVVSDGWGGSHVCSIAEVWIEPPRPPKSVAHARRRVYVTLLSAGAAAGAIIGSLITLVLTR